MTRLIVAIAGLLCLAAPAVAQVDLSLGFYTTPPGTANANSPVTYQFQVTGTASNVWVTAVFNPAIRFTTANAAASTSGCVSNIAPSNLVPPDPSATITCPWTGNPLTIQVTAPATGPLNVIAGVIANDPTPNNFDPTPSNNWATATTSITAFTSTPTPTPTATFTPTRTFTPSQTFTPTNTFTRTFTFTATNSPTITPTPTQTFTPTRTFTASNTPVATSTFTPTPTRTFTPSRTFTATRTFTPTLTPTLGPRPQVNSVTPTSGPAAGGTFITVAGVNFVTGATLTLGGTPATSVVVVSSTSITGVTGVHAAGSVQVVVTNPDGQSGHLDHGYTYGNDPVITSINPISGPVSGGTTVTINGVNFVSGATVGWPTAFISSTQLQATTTSHPEGIVDVAVTNPDSQSFDLVAAYAYGSPVPTITKLTPPNGPAAGGQVVNIMSTNIQRGATITLGGVPMTGLFFAANPKATTGPHAPGLVDATVTNPGGQGSTLTNAYTYQ